MAKTILIISGGIEAVPGIIRAKQLGFNVVVADGNPKAPGFKHADDHIICSTYDPERMALSANEYTIKKHKIHGVLSIAADVPLTVSTVAQKLGLIGHTNETAILSSDKYLMKKRFINK